MSGFAEPVVHLVLYDGVCGLCDRFVQFVLRRDTRARFRFAALQDELARELLLKHGRAAGTLDTVGVVVGWRTDSEALLVKSDAACFVWRELGGAWTIASWLRLLPRGLRDFGYDRVASVRYRVFGRLAACRVPTIAERARFVASPNREGVS